MSKPREYLLVDLSSLIAPRRHRCSRSRSSATSPPQIVFGIYRIACDAEFSQHVSVDLTDDIKTMIANR